MITPEIYHKFRNDVLEVINNDIFEVEKIKVLVGIMGSGKSYFQGDELPQAQLNAFPKLKFIIRVAPKRETCDDGIFPREKHVDGKKFKYRDITHIKESSQLEEKLEDCADTDNVYIFSITHARFSKHFDVFKKYADVSCLWIEEVHEFLAVGDPGSTKYGFGTGYKSGFDARVALRLKEWMKINGRVIAFTATPTLHQQEYDEYIEENGKLTSEKFSNLFHKCNELWNDDVELPSAIPNQSWVDKTIRYDLVRKNPQECVDEYVGDMIDSLIEREEQLEDLKKKDPNIQSKLTSLIRCGQSMGVWGCPIHKGPFGGGGKSKKVYEHDIGMVQIVGKHLQTRGYDIDSPMIATLQEDGGGGNRIWNLNGEVVEQKLTWDEVRLRLIDNEDPLRHLIVVHRGGSGINVHNIGAIFIAAVRDAIWSRDHIPNQVFGRGVRCNWGYGNISGDYINDLRNFIPVKQLDSNIDTVVEAIKIANKLDIWYPRGYNEKGGRTKVDVWSDAIEIFRKTYCNSVEEGYKWLHDHTGTKPEVIESFVPLPEELLCPHCGEPVFYSKDKMGDGTLLPFFDD